MELGEPRRIRITHAAGFKLTTGVGLELPLGQAPLEIALPTSGRNVYMVLTNVPSGAEVRATHARRLVHYQNTTRAEPNWVVLCRDAADEIQVLAPGARIRLISWIRVPGDLAGWLPLVRFPALGTAPLDRAGIAARLGNVGLPDAERDEHLTRVLDAIRAGAVAAPLTWQADGGGPGIELESGMLLSTLTLQPRLAWAFGCYLADPQPAWVPSDYLVVGAWFDPRYAPVSKKYKENGVNTKETMRRVAAAAAAPPSAPLPFIPGGPALDDLIDVLARHNGLLYFAPCYAVMPTRAWEPPFGTLTALEAVPDEARRQLDDQGRALLELPLRAMWSLHRTDGLPLLAAQQTPMARVTFAGPGADGTARVVVSSTTNGGPRATAEMVTPRIPELPGIVQVSLNPLDLFGHVTGRPTTRSLALPANLYPAAPPPIGVIPELVPPAGTGQRDLRITWLWGGRLRLFHPNVHGFVVEWLQDTDLPANLAVQEALRSGISLNWKALPQIAAVAPHAARIDALEPALAGQSTAAVLLQEGTTYLAGIKTDLRIAPGATGRFNGWSLELGAQSFTVVRHMLGDDARLFLSLPGGAAGTPFAGFAADVEQPFATPWTLTPPASTPATSLAVRVSGTAADLQTLVPGSLITQEPLVFGVLARVPGPPALALLDISPGPQEPGAPASARPLPAVGDVLFDAPMTTVVAGVSVTAPTPSHAKRVIWVRVRTVDFLDRPGTPTTPTDASWSKTFPPVPAAGPAVVRRSPPDASGRCKLLVHFDKTLADHGCVLFRASDAQLAVVFKRAKDKVTVAQAAGNAMPAFTPLPAGFVWPVGGPQRPEDVTDPLKDFAALTDMMRVFYNELRIDEGAGPRLVFIDAFERRGRMTRPNQSDQLFAAANDDPLELEDVVDRAGNKYLYLVRPIDRADQEGGVSGVSLPGQGWDISAPAMPELLPTLVTQDELIVRWRPVRDARVTGYRVTQTPTWQGAPAATVVKRALDQFPSPIRLEGDRVALPELVLTPAVTDVTSVTTVADGVEHVDDGFVMPAEQQFVWWCAAGNRALVVTDPVAGGDIRTRVPAEYSYSVADASAVNPVPLVLYRGVLDGEPLRPLATGTFASMFAQDSGGTFTDQTAVGTWHDDGFLTPPAGFEEGEAAVLETAAPDGTRRTFGRCPGAPGQPLIAVTDGVIPLAAVAARLAAGDRPSGVFRASAVTQADAGATPRPRESGAMDMIDATTWYTSGFVRRLRNGVPMIVRWRRLSDGRERFLVTAPGGRPLRFLDGSMVVPPWNPGQEVLNGVYERATVNVSSTTATVPAGARDFTPDVTADPGTGRIVTVLPDGVPVRLRLQNGNEITARFDPLEWRARRLKVGGLFGDGVLVPGALYTFEPDGAGQMVPRAGRDRFGAVDGAPDGSVFVAKSVPPEGATIELEYDSDGVARTVDPRRLEWSTALTAADVGRRWEIRVEALCDFPAPVGEVASRPAVTQVEVMPPANVKIQITSAQWTAAPALEVRFSGPAAVVYRVEAVSEATGRRYVLADPAGSGVVTTATATDGTPLPLREALRVEVRARFPNATASYLAPTVTVPAAQPGDS